MGTVEGLSGADKAAGDAKLALCEKFSFPHFHSLSYNLWRDLGIAGSEGAAARWASCSRCCSFRERADRGEEPAEGVCMIRLDITLIIVRW